MNEAVYNANTYIGYEIVIHRYTFDIYMYSSINNAYNVMMSNSLSDGHITIVHTDTFV